MAAKRNREVEKRLAELELRYRLGPQAPHEALMICVNAGIELPAWVYNAALQSSSVSIPTVEVKAGRPTDNNAMIYATFANDLVDRSGCYDKTAAATVMHAFRADGKVKVATVTHYMRTIRKDPALRVVPRGERQRVEILDRLQAQLPRKFQKKRK